MFKGSFLASLFNNSYLRETIKSFDSEMYIFIKECFISDLVMNYNNTGENKVFYSNEIIPVYYNILKQNEKFLSDKIVEKNKSTGQERYRIINRNIFSSNSKNRDGLQNRDELSCVKKNKTIGYKLSDDILLNSNKQSFLDRMIFLEKFSYLYNHRKLFAKNGNIVCSCGNNKKILMKLKKNEESLPLPISKHIEFKCVKCFLINEYKEMNIVIRGD